MTLASALFSGGGALPYRSGGLYPLTARSSSSASSSVNEDWLTPFTPRKTVVVDKVCWYRDNTTAANVYVGIYNVAGALLTDCAVDTNTTVGWHAVDTTNVTLLPTETYLFAWNSSADVATVHTDTDRSAAEFGAFVDWGATPGGFNAISKARTNAALLSTLTTSGWSDESSFVSMGIVPA